MRFPVLATAVVLGLCLAAGCSAIHDDGNETSGTGHVIWRPSGIWRQSLATWPPKSGLKVRAGFSWYTLAEDKTKGGCGGQVCVFSAAGRPDLLIKVVGLEQRATPGYGDEPDNASQLDRIGVPHMKIVGFDRERRVVIKQVLQGKDAETLVADGAFAPEMRQALVDLSARLITSGYTGNLQPDNLIWDGGRWVVKDCGGFEPGPPGRVLREVMEGAFAGVIPPVDFLAQLKAKLGPSSPAWQQVQHDAGFSPAVQEAFDVLERNRT